MVYLMLALAILANAQPMNFSFTLDPSVPNGDGTASSVGSIDARNYQIHLDHQPIHTKTSCPIQNKTLCPRNHGLTQFNTSLYPPIGEPVNVGPGEVFMVRDAYFSPLPSPRPCVDPLERSFVTTAYSS